MMKICTQSEVQRRKEKYKGRWVRLISMDDVQAPPAGTVGYVVDVDDIGQLMMRWKSEGSLALLPGIDKFELLAESEVLNFNE